MVTTQPDLLSLMNGIVAVATSNTPKTLVSNWRRRSRVLRNSDNYQAKKFAVDREQPTRLPLRELEAQILQTQYN